MRREVQVMELVSSGVENNAKIGRRLGIDRSTVMRIRRKKEASSCSSEDVAVGAGAFAAPKLAPSERWPAVQFMKSTGVVLERD